MTEYAGRLNITIIAFKSAVEPPMPINWKKNVKYFRLRSFLPPRMLLQFIKNCERNFKTPFAKSGPSRYDRRYRANFLTNDTILISQKTAFFIFEACGKMLFIKSLQASLINVFQAFSFDAHFRFILFAQFFCLRLIND